jgi:probable rRNA maturation factor
MTASRPPRRRAPSIDVVIESARWRRAPHAASVVRRAIVAATPAQPRSTEVSVVLTSDRAIRTLNRRWRGRDKSTNVLSFPSPAPVGKQPLRGAPRHLGDIVLAYETVVREARAEGKPLDHHIAHLALHGFLHLLGYDHESHGQAEAMERRERRILARLGVPDPYAEPERGTYPGEGLPRTRSGVATGSPTKDMRKKISNSHG